MRAAWCLLSRGEIRVGGALIGVLLSLTEGNGEKGRELGNGEAVGRLMLTVNLRETRSGPGWD